MNSHPHLLLFLGSGLGYYLDAPATVAKLRVSIPFHSGLGYYKWMADNRPEWSLNPFSFRAGVLRSGGCGRLFGSVSIPFHSGLGYYLRDSPCIRLFGEVSIPFHSGLGYYTTGEV